MTQDDALYRFRLRALALATELGNVRAACRAMGIHPSTFYRWRSQVLRFGPGADLDRAALAPVPDRPYVVCERHLRVVGKDALVSFEASLYSVPWTAVRPPPARGAAGEALIGGDLEYRGGSAPARDPRPGPNQGVHCCSLGPQGECDRLLATDSAG